MMSNIKVSKKAHEVALHKQLTSILGFSATSVLLAQIMFWFMASQNTGKPKTTIRREGKRWVAKTKNEWAEEAGISFHQCKRGLVSLKNAGIIEVQRKMFKGQVMCHVWLNTLKLNDVIAANYGVLAPPHPLITMADDNGVVDDDAEE